MKKKCKPVGLAWILLELGTIFSQLLCFGGEITSFSLAKLIFASSFLFTFSLFTMTLLFNFSLFLFEMKPKSRNKSPMISEGDDCWTSEIFEKKTKIKFWELVTVALHFQAVIYSRSMVEFQIVLCDVFNNKIANHLKSKVV